MAEHILLESDERTVPGLRGARKIHARLRVRSSLRRRSVELALIDYHYLSVQTCRLGRPALEYVLDLRFVDPRLRLSRHIAWRWIRATAVLAALTVGVASWIHASSTPWWRHDWVPVFGALLGLTVCSGLVATYRTTKTLELFSVNGQARLVELTGGVGSFGAIRRFTHALTAHVTIAIGVRRTTRGAHLRDEMREHTRLKEVGALSAHEYETSKRRILARHA